MNKLTISIIVIILLFTAIIGICFIFQKPAFPEEQKAKTLIQKTQRQEIGQDSPFGMHGVYSRPFFTDDMTRIPGEMDKRTAEVKEPYKHVQDIGVRWVRLNSDIYWSMVQPTLEHRKNGIFNWTTIDMFHGRVPSDVNILGTIDARPWGSNDPTFKPYTWDFADEEMERYYIKFVQETVERYDGDGIKDMPGLKSPIKYWQVSNEPALRPLVERWEDVETVRENLKKNLDPQGFSRLVEITHKAIKDKNPEAKIALAGLAGGHGFVSKDPLTFREVHEFYLPILKNLSGKYIDIFDIHYYGDKGEYDEYQGMKLAYDFFRRELDQNGYQNTEIWFTETAAPSNKPFGERFQAVNLFKRYVYSLSFGAKKIFWWNMIEGEGPLLADNQPSDHFGLIYDGIGNGDPGYGTKKLSYYTYKKMVEVLEGSDWDNMQTIQESDGLYIYKFTKNNKPIWVAWNDNSGEKTITISGISSSSVKITEAVPKYESGKDVADYSTAFNTETKTASGGKITITLGDKPVFVEEK